MAQSWAKDFYNSPKWLKTRKNYLRHVVDMSGHVLTADDGSYFYLDEHGKKVIVDKSDVIPPGMCERCFARGELNPAKVVHHIDHLTPQNVNDPHYTLRYGNLMRLCQDCHAYVHSGQDEPRVGFDENGNVIPKKETLRDMVMRLTETVEEKRNIHKETHGHMR